MSPSSAPSSVSAPRKRPRGVYFAAAPNGMVRITAIDSTGAVFCEYMVRAGAYEERVGEYLRRQLDRHDPRPKVLCLLKG